MTARKDFSEKSLFGKDDLISEYTTAQAEEDGFLVRNIWEPGVVVSHVTRAVFDHYTSLIGSSPITGPVINVTELGGVIVEADKAIRKRLEEDPDEWLVTGIKGPDKRELWAALNDQGRWTLMFPEDY